MTKKLVQLALAIVIVGLAYVIYDQISTPIRFEKETAQKKALVIERIKDIRDAERAFKSKYQRFTGDFGTKKQLITTQWKKEPPSSRRQKWCWPKT